MTDLVSCLFFWRTVREYRKNTYVYLNVCDACIGSAVTNVNFTFHMDAWRYSQFDNKAFDQPFNFSCNHRKHNKAPFYRLAPHVAVAV